MPIGPPTVFTSGEAKLREALPVARFTVTGPAASNGDGPDVPSRRSTLKRLRHGLSRESFTPSLVSAIQAY